MADSGRSAIRRIRAESVLRSRDAPTDAVQLLGRGDAEALQKALGVKTIRQLAENTFVRAAQAITLLAGAK